MTPYNEELISKGAVSTGLNLPPTWPWVGTPGLPVCPRQDLPYPSLVFSSLPSEIGHSASTSYFLGSKEKDCEPLKRPPPRGREGTAQTMVLKRWVTTPFEPKCSSCSQDFFPFIFFFMK